VVYQTARTDLLGLVDLGMLVKAKVGRSFVFLASESLQDKLTNFESWLDERDDALNNIHL
jgi:hypothetical protein